MTIFSADNEKPLLKSILKTFEKHHGDSLLFFDEYDDDNETEQLWSDLLDKGEK